MSTKPATPGPDVSSSHTKPDLEAHGDIELKKTSQTENQPAPATKRSRGRPKSHGLTNTGTYRSYKSAKNRCTNPNDSQYKDYGGRGIEFRLASVTDLIAAIGERPEGWSLDRIDTNGHYEVGNLRWASPKQQAANRRPPDFYREQSIQRRWYDEKEIRALKSKAYRWWSLSVGLFNSELTEHENDELFELHAKHGIPYATFDLDDPRDMANTGFIKLPSLTHPSRYVVLQGGSFGHQRGSPKNRQGFISGMGNVDLAKNCTREEIEIIRWLCSSNAEHRSVCYTGPEWGASDIPIEGRLMAIAACLANRRDTRFVPVVELEAHLLASDTEHLVEGCLVLPDLNVTRPGFGLDHSLQRQMLELLQERVREGLPTLVYAEDPIQLGRQLALFFEAHYRTVPLESLPAHSNNRVSFVW